MMDYTDVLLPEPAPGGPEFWRGTIVGTNPLRVERVQGVMPATPENFTGHTLTDGDRVIGATIDTRPVLIGRTGGVVPLAEGDAGVTQTVEAGAQVTIDVNFPSPLPNVKRVMVTMTGTNRLIPRVIASSLNPDGFQVQLRNVSTGATSSISFWWAAFG